MMPSLDQATYMRAAEIADKLLSRGLPVVGFGAPGGKICVRFQLEADGASYAALLPFEGADADRFADLYEAMK